MPSEIRPLKERKRKRGHSEFQKMKRAPGPISRHVAGRLSIYFVVASDVEQSNLFLGHTKRQGDTVGIGDTHGMKPFELSTERMQSKGRLKWIGFEISQNFASGFLSSGWARVKLTTRRSK